MNDANAKSGQVRSQTEQVRRTQDSRIPEIIYLRIGRQPRPKMCMQEVMASAALRLGQLLWQSCVGQQPSTRTRPLLRDFDTSATAIYLSESSMQQLWGLGLQGSGFGV